MKRLIPLLLVVLLLSGCGTTKEVVKWKTEYVFIQPSPVMYTRVPAVAPPQPATYAQADPDTREKMLMKSFHENYQAIGSCNRKLHAIQEWVVKNKATYGTGPAEKK